MQTLADSAVLLGAIELLKLVGKRVVECRGRSLEWFKKVDP